MADEEKKEQVTPEAPEENIVNAIPEGKADIGKRIVAFIIDAVLTTIVIIVIPFIGFLISGAYWLLRDGIKIDFMDQRSLGKKLMKLRPVTLEGKNLEIIDSVKRNWMFAIMAIPIIGWIAGFILLIVEIILTLTDEEGRRFGDKIANTKVIQVED
ncbi:MAG: RDD family protein [Calditrichia bacterium]|nr:RDD family protein [Calditrichia bacterium]